jgi:hypothetical protein
MINYSARTGTAGIEWRAMYLILWRRKITRISRSCIDNTVGLARTEKSGERIRGENSNGGVVDGIEGMMETSHR